LAGQGLHANMRSRPSTNYFDDDDEMLERPGEDAHRQESLLLSERFSRDIVTPVRATHTYPRDDRPTLQAPALSLKFHTAKPTASETKPSKPASATATTTTTTTNLFKPSVPRTGTSIPPNKSPTPPIPDIVCVDEPKPTSGQRPLGILTSELKPSTTNGLSAFGSSGTGNNDDNVEGVSGIMDVQPDFDASIVDNVSVMLFRDEHGAYQRIVGHFWHLCKFQSSRRYFIC
jgi:hypothetical protein